MKNAPESAHSASKQYETILKASIYEVNAGNLVKVHHEECSTYRFIRDYINNYKSYIRHI